MKLYRTLWLLALGISIISVIGYEPLKMLLAIPGTLLMFVILCFAYVLILFIISLFYDFDKEYKSESKLARILLPETLEAILILFGVKIHANGLDKIKNLKKFLLVSNHISLFDPFISISLLKNLNMKFVVKPEVYDIPIAGKFAMRQGFLKINRESIKEAAKTINKAADELTADNTVVGIFPEGTRSLDGNLLPMRNGAFSIAKKAGCPVVVASVYGTEKIEKNFFRRRTDVYFDILDIIDGNENSIDIGNKVTDLITESKEKLESEGYVFGRQQEKK